MSAVADKLDNEFLVNQIGALYWSACVAYLQKDDKAESDRLLTEANGCRDEVLRRLTHPGASVP